MLKLIPVKKKRSRAAGAAAKTMMSAKKRTLTASKYIMTRALQVRKQFPAPPKLRTTCRYFGNFKSINGGLGGTADTVVFSANGMWDPDITAVGHQPVGFDQFMALYDHYTVLGAKITAFYRNAAAQPYICYLAVRDTNVTSTDSRVLIENGYVDFQVIDGTGNDRAMCTLKQNVDIGKFLARNDPLSDPQLKGSSSANPTEGVFFHVGGFAFNNEDAGAVQINVVIEYDVVFHERLPTLPS